MNASDTAYLRIENIRKSYDDLNAVDTINLDIHKGEIFALLGASGCGKSTLLRILAGFEQPSDGHIYLDGEDMLALAPYERPINMMFQSYALFPHMTVEQNVAFGLKQERMNKGDIKHRVEEMLNLVRMDQLAKRKPDQLSGGQQQRVALARSLAKGPKLLLLDEPMAALDKQLRSHMQSELVSIIQRLGVTCVMVTHDQDEAMSMAHRIAIMNAGKILQTGTADDIYEQPNCRYTAQFIGSINVFEGVIDNRKAEYSSLRSPLLPTIIHVEQELDANEGDEAVFAIRPEKLQLLKNEPKQDHNKLEGIIKNIAYFGSHSVYHVTLASGATIRCNVANMGRWTSETFACEDLVWLSWQDDSGILLTS